MSRELLAGCYQAIRYPSQEHIDLLQAIEKELAKPEPEPVAYTTKWPDGSYDGLTFKNPGLSDTDKEHGVIICPLFESQPDQSALNWKPAVFEYDRSIHHNPDAKAWADLFMKTFPHSGADKDTIHGWFANAMMAMHDYIKQDKFLRIAELKAINTDLLEALQEMIDVTYCADETRYIEGHGFVDIDSVKLKARSAIAKANGYKVGE